MNYSIFQGINFFKKHTKEGAYVILTILVQVFEKVLVIIVVSRALSVSDFGIYGLALTVSSLIFLILYSPFYAGLKRYSVISKSLDQENNFISIILRSWTIISLLVLSLLILFYPTLIILNKSQWFEILSLVLAFTILSSLVELIVTYYKSVRKHGKALLIRTTDMFVKFLLLILLGVSDIKDIFIIFIFSNIILLPFFLRFFTGKISFKLNIKKLFWIQKIFNFSKYFFYWGIFYWIQLNCSKWIIEFLDTNENLGLFNALNQISITPVIILGTTIVAFLSPIINEKTDIRGKSKIDLYKLLKNINLIIPFVILVTSIFIYFFGESIVLILLGDKFLQLNNYYIIATISSVFYVQINITSSFIYTKNKPEVLLNINILHSIFTVIVSLPMIYYFSLYGAVYSLLVVNFLAYLATFLKARKVLSTNIN